MIAREPGHSNCGDLGFSTRQWQHMKIIFITDSRDYNLDTFIHNKFPTPVGVLYQVYSKGGLDLIKVEKTINELEKTVLTTSI